MTASKDLFGRLEAVMDNLTAALSSHNRLAVVTEIAACASQVDMDAMCDEARLELNATICLVTLLTDTREDFLGSAGLLDPAVKASGIDVADSLCQFVVATGDPLQIDNTDTFCSVTPGMTGMAGAGMHSYLGEPIEVRGQTVGSFCALDAEARHWTDDERVIVRRWADRAAVRLTDAVNSGP